MTISEQMKGGEERSNGNEFDHHLLSSSSDIDGRKDEFVALMQRSLDGTFYFSSAAPKSIVDSISKREISKIRILPSASIGRVSNLGVASLRGPLQRRGVRKPPPTGIRVRGPEFLEYGGFSSFAPSIDSSSASLSASDAVALAYPNRRVEIEKRDFFVPVPAYDTLPIYNGIQDESFVPIGDVGVAATQTSFSSSNNIATVLPTDFPPLLNEKDIPQIKKALENTSCKDIDIAALLKLPAQFSQLKKSSKVPVLVDDLLAENKLILKELIALQKQRYVAYSVSSRKSLSVAPSATPVEPRPDHSVPYPREMILADHLMENLAALTRWSKPGAIKKGLSDEVERAAQLYSKGILETSWRGELSYVGMKGKGLSTNVVGDPAFGM